MSLGERLREFLQLLRELTHPLRAWKNWQAISEHHDALEAEFARFCAGRGLDPGEEAHAAWWDHLDEVSAAFAELSGLDPGAEETLAQLEAAWVDFERWCLQEARQPYAPGEFARWLSPLATS